MVAIWTPPFIGDRLKHSEPHSCIWEPNDNTEFVIFVAVIGHYIPCIIMVFCYIKVYAIMNSKYVGPINSMHRSMTLPLAYLNNRLQLDFSPQATC